jgi:glutamate dehydrogenase/leucine dehydrogenase
MKLLFHNHGILLMNKKKIAVNGFGRIGRTLTRLLMDDARFEVVAINDVADIEYHGAFVPIRFYSWEKSSAG